MQIWFASIKYPRDFLSLCYLGLLYITTIMALKSPSGIFLTKFSRQIEAELDLSHQANPPLPKISQRVKSSSSFICQLRNKPLITSIYISLSSYFSLFSTAQALPFPPTPSSQSYRTFPTCWLCTIHAWLSSERSLPKSLILFPILLHSASSNQKWKVSFL